MKVKFPVILLLLIIVCSANSSAINYMTEEVKVGDIIVCNSPYVDVKAFSNLSSAIRSSNTVGKTILITNRQVVNNLNIPSDRNIRIEKGGLIIVNKGNTLIFNNNIQAGNYQIFSGNGIVSGLTDISATWWGAAATATAETNSVAIQASIRALNNQGNWLLPAGEYKINSALLFKDLSDCNVHFQGRIVNDTSHGIVLDNLNRCTVTGIDVGRSKASPENWSGVGVDIINALNRCSIQVDRIFGFKYGIKIYSTSNNSQAIGMAWNSFKLGELRDNQTAVWVEETGLGYFNQNTFHSGHILLSSEVKQYDTANGNTTYGIYFSPVVSWIYSNNSFYNTDISNIGNGIKLQGAYNFSLDGVRFETVANYWVDAQSGSSLTIRPATDFDASKYLFSSQMRGVNIIGAAKYNSSTYKSMVMDNRFGGITFADLTAPDTTLMHLYTDLTNRSGLVFSNYLNGVQSFDKQFTNSAVPSTGTYNKNAVVWNSTVVAGQPMGWVVSRRGTMGELKGVTGNIKKGSSVLVVNDSSALKIGESIVVDRALTTGTILNIMENKVTLDVTATVSVTDAIVSYQNAVWVRMPNFQE